MRGSQMDHALLSLSAWTCTHGSLNIPRTLTLRYNSLSCMVPAFSHIIACGHAWATQDHSIHALSRIIMHYHVNLSIFAEQISSADHHNAAADIYNHVHYILDAIHLGCGPATLQWALTIVLGMCSTSCILGAIYEKDESDVIQWAKDLLEERSHDEGTEGKRVSILDSS